MESTVARGRGARVSPSDRIRPFNHTVELVVDYLVACLLYPDGILKPGLPTEISRTSSSFTTSPSLLVHVVLGKYSSHLNNMPKNRSIKHGS